MKGVRGLVLLFGLTILLPGVVLAVLGVRALLQERVIAEQQLRSDLDRAAASAGTGLSRELEAWATALAQTGRATDPNWNLLPDLVRRAIDQPGVAVLVLNSSATRAWPERAMAYLPWATEVPSVLAPELASAEAVELAGTDHTKAIVQYQLLLRTASADDRAWLLHRLARTSRKARLGSGVTHALDSLEQMRGFHVDDLPADFLARYEKCAYAESVGARTATALGIYRELIQGRWIFDAPRYQYYVSRLREWAKAESEEIGRLDSIRSRREALTSAAAKLAEADQSGAYLVIGEREGRVTTTSATLVIDAGWLAQHLQPVASTGAGTGVVTSVHLERQSESANRTEAAAADLTSTRRVSAAGHVWRIDVRKEQPELAFAELGRRQRMYVAMLAGVVVVMGFGTYLTGRVVRRELEVARMKSDFVAAVSHEFRSPLSGIRQLGEMLMRGRVPSEARRQEYYERITHESDRLSRVVENLLDFTRMEEGRRPFSFERVDPGEWLRSTVKAFEAQEAHRSHRVETAIGEALPMVAIDREAFATVLDNVLGNAVKYSPNADTVWLEAVTEGQGLVVRVRDRGVGIAVADQPHVFDRFYRGVHGTTRTVRGTGLGLSLVRHIVRAHGGRVTLESVPGAGTTVSIHLKASA